MPSTTVSVRINPASKKRLEKLAKSTGRSRSFLAAEVINEYLDLNEWQVAGIAKAMASLDRGEGVSHGGSKSGSVPGATRRSDCLLNARRHEHPLVARCNRRPDFASSLYRAR
jgi:RHH-type transcriptional regulator, rel operon repressor / antitoxin RelB